MALMSSSALCKSCMAGVPLNFAMQSTLVCKYVEFADCRPASGGGRTLARLRRGRQRAAQLRWHHPCLGGFLGERRRRLGGVLAPSCSQLGKQTPAQALRIGEALRLRAEKVAHGRLD